MIITDLNSNPLDSTIFSGSKMDADRHAQPNKDLKNPKIFSTKRVSLEGSLESPSPILITQIPSTISVPIPHIGFEDSGTEVSSSSFSDKEGLFGIESSASETCLVL